MSLTLSDPQARDAARRVPRKKAGAPLTLDYFKSRSAVDATTGCWLWTGATNGSGYGAMQIGGKTTRAHRAIYQLAHGRELPRSIDVCHRCDVRLCVNPDHLFEGTRTDNMRDCATKGRIKVPGLAGDDSPNSKLTSAQARLIRADPRPSSALAGDYGVTVAAIKAVRSGETWRSAGGQMGPRAPRNQAGEMTAWNASSDEYIRTHARDGSFAIALALGRTVAAVRNRSSILGVSLPRTHRRAK